MICDIVRISREKKTSAHVAHLIGYNDTLDTHLHLYGFGYRLTEQRYKSSSTKTATNFKNEI